MATIENPDMIEIEIDNFVSPNAASDVPSDDFVALDMGAPIALPEAPIAVAMPVEAETVEETPDVNPMGDLAAALAEIGTQAANNAAGVTSGSFASGTLQSVGFTTAQGYVTALTNGVKQATADLYLDTLRNRFGFDANAIGALHVSIIPENNDLPVGPGIVVDASGGLTPREAMQRLRDERAGRVARPGANGDTSDVAPVIADFDGTIVVESITEKLHGLSLHYGPCQIPRHSIARDIVIDLLVTNGFADCTPALRTGNAQLRKVMNSLNSQMARDAREDDLRLKTWNVTQKDSDRMGMDWPANLDSRWCVGTLDATTDLGTMGAKVLVVSLVEIATDDGTEFEVQFTGGTERMRRAVVNRFDSLYGTSAMNVTDLVAWYKHVLETKFNAIRQGFKFLIVGTDANQANMERAERFMHTLQGADIYGPSPIMGRRLDCDKVTSRTGASWESFCLNVGAGMVEDTRMLGMEFAAALKIAQDRALEKSVKRNESPEDQTLAVRRAVIGTDHVNSAAKGLLARLVGLAGRARDSVSLIGRAHALAAINACEALRSEWIGKCHADNTVAFGAMIELD